MKNEECIIAIFGATGDLTQRKLLPSLFGLYANGLAPSAFSIMAVGRSDIKNDDFITKAKASINKVRDNFVFDCTEEEKDFLVERFLKKIFYKKANALNSGDYEDLKETLYSKAEELGTNKNFIFYMSTPPSAYTTIAENLNKVGLNKEDDGWRRLIIEKPFGYDVESAKELNISLHKYFDEKQLYRIDHYLGKETVQNILVFRFANALFEPLWNRNYIDFVEITGAENIGVENRASYYDNSGALRDMLQNHLLNVMSFVAMEAPARIDADSIRDEQVKVIRSLKPITQETINEQVLLAQYAESDSDNSIIPYLQIEGVNPESTTETYIQTKLEIDNWRWAGVPFYIRTGKNLKERVAEIVIHFKKTPHQEFKTKAPANNLVIRLQPAESIHLNFGMKKPGSGFNFEEVALEFEYSDLDKKASKMLILDAYQRLLLDSIRGDATLFTRSDFVQECWKYVQPIIDYKKNNPIIHTYKSGSWGPDKTVDLLQKDGFTWYLDTLNKED